MSSNQTNKKSKKSFSKAAFKRMAKIDKKFMEIFKDDVILLCELKREINAQQRKAS